MVAVIVPLTMEPLTLRNLPAARVAALGWCSPSWLHFAGGNQSRLTAVPCGR